MPLYEMMVIAKCSTPEHLASAANTLAKAIWQQGGVVRDVKILTDRYSLNHKKNINQTIEIQGWALRYHGTFFTNSVRWLPHRHG